MNTLLRALLLGLLGIATLGFGAAGLCGAVFTFVVIPGAAFSGGGSGNLGILLVAIPSLVIGGGAAGWCIRKIKSLRGP